MILANKQHTRRISYIPSSISLQKHATPLRTRFFVNYYVPSNAQRAHEIDTCFFFNLSNPEIDEVFVLCDLTTPFPEWTEPYASKITKIDYPHRVLIKDVIDIVNKHTTPETVNIFGNSDIILDEKGIALVRQYSTPTYAYTLTRKNLVKEITCDTPRLQLAGKIHRGTTDTWIVHGKIRIPTTQLNIHFGTLGCDPLLNSILATKYTVLDPYDDVQTYHYHLSKNTNNYHGAGIREVASTVSYMYHNRKILFV